MEKMSIVTVTDDRYAQHLGVMLTSLFENKVLKNLIEIYVVSSRLKQDNKNKLEDICSNYDAICTFVEVNGEQYSNLSVRNHMSHAAYYKISIPYLLSEVDKALFLDCDLIIREDIKDLWDIDIKDYLIAAVENPGFNRHDQLGIPLNHKTFNSGVMLMNLKKWREEKIPEKVIGFLHENSHRLSLHDQDGFNAIMYGQWLHIHPEWNQQTKFFEIKPNEISYSKEEFKKALQQPAIIHYTTSSKPWHFLNKHPYKKEYYKYLRMTEWKDFKPQNIKISHRILKVFINIFPSVMYMKIKSNIRNQFIK
ncbi:glycosyltransferase family 8 protein [Priestia aryabhattai]|uniref:glycosyltransferase family 8 protein n=1 Tax=Priestia aryabhattai TaxID=412384 RepID=UPI0023781404|nr:glycosyltransferase family 8 protein [Priestia aryabhattai]WDL88473.1 glycosyltransferase family 8 protein [Priestia aryabhattai]